MSEELNFSLDSKGVTLSGRANSAGELAEFIEKLEAIHTLLVKFTPTPSTTRGE